MCFSRRIFAGIAATACLVAALQIPLRVGSAFAADDVEPAADEMEDSVPVELPKVERPSGRERPATPDGFGAIGRAGHLAFGTFGRSQSITTIEGLPYWLFEDHFFFSDLRGFVSNSAQFGGNAGLGYRYVPESVGAWFGGSLWYDADDTTGKYFQQVGLSLEAVAQYMEARSNLYLPVGNTKQDFGSSAFGSRFSGNQLLFSSFSSIGTAMTGVDYELGVNLPVTLWHDDDRLRGYIGGYNFSGSNVSNVSGIRLRTEFVWNNAITAQLMYTNDPLFGNNVMVGMQLQYPFGRKHPAFNWKRSAPSPFRYVERNYNVIVNRATSSLRDAVALNPNTGQPYLIEHVAANGSSSGDGSSTSPFATVAQAQSAGGDVIFVHAGTELHDAVALAPGQKLLGEVAGGKIETQNFGTVLMPFSAGNVPTISQVGGSAIMLANNSQVSGFNINNVFSDGIVGNSVTGVSVNNVSFSNIAGDALRLSSTTGTVNLSGLTFDTTGGRGVVIDGGAPDVTFDGTLAHTSGDAFVVQNTTAGTVTLNSVTLDHPAARGLVVSNLGGTLNANGLTVKSSGDDAISVNGGTGTMSLLGATLIDHPQGRGLAVNNSGTTVNVTDLEVTSTSTASALNVSQTTQPVTINSMNLNTTGGPGLTANSAELLTINAGTITSVGAPAVDVANSALAVSLVSASVNGGPVGIRIVNSTGGFTISGDKSGQYSTGGTIQNTGTAIALLNAGTVTITHVDLVGNSNGVVSTGNDFLQLASLRVTTTQHFAIDSLNDKILGIGSSIFAQNGQIGEGTIRIRDNIFGTYQTAISNNAITDDNGTALAYSGDTGANGSALSLTMQSNAIIANRSGNSAVLIGWNGPLGINAVNNTLVMNSANMVGIDWHASSTSDQVNAVMTGNTLTFASSGGIGIRSVAESTASLQYGANNVTFNGASGTGFDFTQNGASDVWLYSNTITDNAAGATGMLFHNIAANSRVQIEGNTINLLSTSPIVDNGIIFLSAQQTVGLFSNANNIVNGATTSFAVPTGTTTGFIVVNGQAVP